MKEVDNNGFWRVRDNPLSKSGVFPYLGKQISGDLEPNRIYKVYRPMSEISAPETIESFDGIPLIDEHEMIGEGWTDYDDRPAGGVVYHTYAKDGKLFGDIRIFSEQLKDEIKNGKKELSMGYSCRYEPEQGMFDGEYYDFVQRDLRGNHVALVNRGRMGADVRVYDQKITFDTLDGLTFEENTMEAQDREWNEADHPRDENNQKFVSKNSGSNSQESKSANNEEYNRTRENKELLEGYQKEKDRLLSFYNEAKKENIDTSEIERQLNDIEKQIEFVKNDQKKVNRGDLGAGSPRHIYGQKKDGSIPVALKTTNYPNWNKVEILKKFDKEDDALNYAEERGEAVKSDYQNRTRNSEKYGIATWVTPKELEHIKKYSRFPDNEEQAQKDYTIAHKDNSGNITKIAEVHKEDISSSNNKMDYNDKAVFQKGGQKVIVRGNGQVRWYKNGKMLSELNQQLNTKEDIDEMKKHFIELGYSQDKEIPSQDGSPKESGVDCSLNQQGTDSMEKVDKRKGISEVEAMLYEAKKDPAKLTDELIKTILQKMENNSYEASEKTEADDESVEACKDGCKAKDEDKEVSEEAEKTADGEAPTEEKKDEEEGKKEDTKAEDKALTALDAMPEILKGLEDIKELLKGRNENKSDTMFGLDETPVVSNEMDLGLKKYLGE